MAESVNRIQLREGFKQPIDMNNIFETLRYIDMKKHPEVSVPELMLNTNYQQILNDSQYYPE